MAAREQSERVTPSHLVVRLPVGPLLIHSPSQALGFWLFGFLAVKFRPVQEISRRMKDDGEVGEQHIRNRVCEQTRGWKKWRPLGGRCEQAGDG